jgi:peptidoglycan/LPS O-acetylase OafA/YrhL
VDHWEYLTVEICSMKNSVRKERNIKLDIIRFTGVLIIMVAHSNPPEWLFQLRNFGAPLLILGSALTYSFIYKHKTINKGEFFKKRLTRLIIPLWLFLTFFFLFFWIISLVIEERSFPFSAMYIIRNWLYLDF